MLASLLVLSAAALAADAVTPPTTKEPEWSVQARWVNDRPKSTGKIQAPRITLRDGQTATVSDISQRAFVTAVKNRQDGKRQVSEPVITLLSEGVRIDLTVEGVDRPLPTLDVTVEYSKIDGVEQVSLTDDPNGSTIQAPRLVTTKVRTLKSVRLGETTTIKLGKNDPRSVELVVKRR